MRAFLNYLYYIYYVMKQGPAIGTMSFFAWIYFLVFYFLTSIFIGFNFLSESTIYVILGAGIIIFIGVYVLYRDDEKMWEVVQKYDAKRISKLTIWFQGLVINLLPVIVFLVAFYFKYKR